MPAIVFSPNPLTVNEDALRTLESFAEAKDVSAESVSSSMIDFSAFRHDAAHRLLCG